MPNGRPKIWRSVDTSSDNDHHHDADDVYDAADDDLEHVREDSRNEYDGIVMKLIELICWSSDSTEKFMTNILFRFRIEF